MTSTLLPEQGKPMTNYNERLDKIINNLSGKYSGSIASAMLAGGHPEETIFMINKYGKEAKQAITSLIKELVVEAKPDKYRNNTEYSNGWDDSIDQFEQNLLKALEEV